MASIIPIPTTRVGDFFVRQRLTGQVQNDQLDLFKLQNQISTGRRLDLPSDDAPAALRAINLQRLLDRKGQIQTNVLANNSFLGAADSQLEHVSDVLIKLRADVVAVSGTLSNAADRQALVQQVDGALETLVAAGNATSQGRYLFSGSRSQTLPYDFRDGFVEYLGNEGLLRNYVNLERLFDSNLTGPEVFGGISSKVHGADLDPHLTSTTLVSAINDGNGISRNGAITVSVTTSTSTVTSVIDLSRAVTLGDVARLIEEGAPAGADIFVGVTGTGLTLSTTSGTLVVTEVAQGKTASELGIRTPVGAAPTSTITGAPLNAAVLKTTRLSELLGTKAQARLESINANNDLLLTANQNGAALNNVTVSFVDDSTAGSEIAVYDANTKTLTVHVQDGYSSAGQVAAAINAEGTFTAQLDYHDAVALSQVGAGAVEIKTFTQITSGGSGEVLDTASGLTVNNGGESVTLDTSNVDTVEELLNLINGAGLGLVAEINDARNGINVRSRLSGADFTIGEYGGTLATQLGLRTFTGSSKLAEFNRGVGVPTTETLEALDPTKLDSLRIVARDGTVLNANLAGATTLQHVVDAINSTPGNNAGTTAVLARLSSNGNRVELVDASTVTTGETIVQNVSGTKAAEYLGFVATGAAQKSSSTTEPGGSYYLSGGNVLGNDLLIRARNGTELWIDLAGTMTVNDVLDRINNNFANVGTPRPITARLAQFGNGIELVDASTGGGSLTVQALEGSQAAEFLGFVAPEQTQVSSTTTESSGNYVLQTSDRNTIESDSVFNTLIRLKHALENNDTEEIGRSLERLDTDLSRVNFARADIGTRLQNLEVIGTRLQEEDVQLRAALSNDIDVDLVEAISNLTARQYALQASLQTAGNLLQLSLLDFI